MSFHTNILVLFTYVTEKLGIPNSKKEKIKADSGCTAIILHRIRTLGSTLSLVNKVAESSKQRT